MHSGCDRTAAGALSPWPPYRGGRGRMARMSTYGETPGYSLGLGRSVDNGDQLSSVVLMGIAVAGAAVAILLSALIV
jgi:hypothetical protein